MLQQNRDWAEEFVMKIAFDFGGVLCETTEFREMAKVLLGAGVEVHLITIAWSHEGRAEFVAGMGIPFTGVHIILETGSLDHGAEKVKVMKEIGCNMLIDDSVNVINAVRREGMIGLQCYSPYFPKHREKEIREVSV
jgi:hypothetical protein